MPNAEADIVTQLAGSLGGVTLTSGTNLFRGPVRPVGGAMPAQAVFVLLTGGPPPGMYLNSEDSDFHTSTVQVMVRSSPGAYDVTLARAIWDRLQRATIAGYVSVRVRESEPVYIEQDEQGCHLWSLNVEAWWKG